MRKFHINKFPQDRIYILLDEKFHKKLFWFIKRNFRFKEFNKIYFRNKLNWNNYKQWKRRLAKSNKTHKVRFIPLWFIVNMSKNFKDNFPIPEIENHIIALHGPSSSSVIWKPNLPLIEERRLLKILAHLIGDGHVGGGFGTKLPRGKSSSQYRNFDRGLLDQFSKDLQVFGKVKTTINYERGELFIPNSLGYIIEHIYKVNTDTFNSRLPKEIYNIDRSIISSFLRAFADDEAHVYEAHIDFYSANKYLLIDLMRLIQLKFPEIKISSLKINKNSKNPKYYFYVMGESKEYFLNLIGFGHEQKHKELVFNIERSLLNKRGGETWYDKKNNP